MRISDPVSYFEGCWSYTRRICDYRSGSTGEAHGTATFSRTEDGLTWAESGRLMIDGASRTARRELRIIPDRDSDSGWSVTFDDGRPFHHLNLGEGTCEVEHPCRDDLYEGRVEAGTENAFRTTWMVRGPAKEHLIETGYERLPDA